MKVHRGRSQLGITHCLTPSLSLQHDPLPSYIPQISYNPSPSHRHNAPSLSYIHTQRSRKHRLVQERNTQIQRNNRMLYEKIRKIKLKNTYQSDKKLNGEDNQEESMGARFEESRGKDSIGKPLSLPQVSLNNYSVLSSTKSKLTGILQDRHTFISKYFEEISNIRNKPGRKTQELGNYKCFGWKIKVLLLDDIHLILKGRKGKKQLTKKYIYERVKEKIQINGLEDWTGLKFEFQ